MKNLRAATRKVLQDVEDKTGKSIQFLRDDNLSVLATLTMARNGADFHVLRYKPSDEPLDYLFVYQAGFVLRLFENAPDQRFDFAPAGTAAQHIEELVSAGQPLKTDDQRNLPEFAKFIAHWALMTLRSLPVGMRIDQWIATELPELKEQQQASIALQQQQNTAVLSFARGNLRVPTTLMGMYAAYALFTDRLLGPNAYTIPYEAAGVIGQGEALLSLWDETPPGAQQDCALVDSWARACGMSGWYDWTAYQP